MSEPLRAEYYVILDETLVSVYHFDGFMTVEASALLLSQIYADTNAVNERLSLFINNPEGA